MSLSSNFPTSKPSLNLDFANVGALDPRITFTRSSSATYTNSLGLITTAATNVARFDYDPVTLAARGLLVEEQRTNIAPYSEQFDNAYWVKNLSSVTADTVVSPDGTVDADKFIENTTAGLHRLISGNFSAGTYTLSVFAKAAERTRFEIVTTPMDVAFDLSNGTITSGSGGTITPVGNGWYRCTVAFTVAVTHTLGFGLLNAAGARDYTGDGTSGIYIWGAQLEAGSFATSYIPTPTNSTVTRSADVASVNTLSPWFNATEGTLFVEATMPPSNNSRLAQIGVAGFSYLTQISFESRTSGGTDIRFTTYNDPVYVNLYSPTLSAGQIFKGAGAYKNSDIAASFNGNAAVTSSTANSVYSSMTILGIGQGSTTYANAYIRRLAYYPRRLTNAELQALSA